MAGKSKSKVKSFFSMKNFWNLLVIGLILLSGGLYYITNGLRVENGYYNSDSIIFWDNTMYILFFGLVSGYVISLLISKTSFGKKRD